MKPLFKNISGDWQNKFLLAVGMFILYGPCARAAETLASIQLIESGLATSTSVTPALYSLARGNYQDAQAKLTGADDADAPWLRPYLEGLIPVTANLQRTEFDHFVWFTPPEQAFLVSYAGPEMEKVARVYAATFRHRPAQKIRIEIYPTKEAFSQASTLSEETLKRSGAIGICKFHRLMILSPAALPLGYRWIDSLAHEYTHLVVNELSYAKAELWLQEGTARYFETSYRLDPPDYLTPRQKTDLKKACENKTLISFKRMSPSLVYLKDQEEVSLAFSEVSYAVSDLVHSQGKPVFTTFLRSLSTQSLERAFDKIYGQTLEEFEEAWPKKMMNEPWEKVQGALSDEIRFEGIDEAAAVGADVQARMRLGDRMRQRGLIQAALVEYNKALIEEPDNAILLLKAARTNLALGNSGQAIHHLRQAVLKNPNYGTPLLDLARLVPPEEAMVLLASANAINPFDPEIHLLWGKNLEQLGRMKEARREQTIARMLSR